MYKVRRVEWLERKPTRTLLESGPEQRQITDLFRPSDINELLGILRSFRESARSSDTNGV